MKLLIEKGAQIDMTNNNNETPFYQANREDHKEIARYLLKKKQEVENQNPLKIRLIIIKYAISVVYSG